VNTAHTPGPWIATQDPDGITDDYCIGIADGKIDEVAVCGKRDAGLIAAAPGMFHALTCVVAATTAEDWARAVDLSRAALAKAGTA
jgi:hypothetical protein